MYLKTHMITRTGRKIKKPVMFVPTEDVVNDEFDDDEDDEEDMDENGNLKDFIVDDESESEDA